MAKRSEMGYGILILLMVLGQGTGAVSGEPDNSIQTPEDLVQYVTEAGQYLNDTGVEAGESEIMNRSGLFTRKEAALSVYDRDGTLLAHPSLRDEIGKNQLNLTDTYGMEIVRLERDIAANGSGFFLLMESVSPDSSAGESNASDYLPRLGYVLPVTDQIWIASDVSLQNMKDVTPGRSYLSDLETFVDKAARYARDVGREEAIREFNDLNGSFTNGSMYIYAYDMNGTFLASPYYPEIIGTNQLDVVRSYGVASVAEVIRISRERGSGYVAFVILNPETSRPEPKLGYVEKVDDTWLVGSGIYASDLGNLER